MATMNENKGQEEKDDEPNDSLDKSLEEERDRTLYIWKGNEGRMKFPAEAFQECYSYKWLKLQLAQATSGYSYN